MSIDVRGGTGGITVGLADLEAGSAALGRAALDVEDVAATLCGLAARAADEALAAWAAADSPSDVGDLMRAAWQVEAGLLDAARVAAVEGCSVGALASSVRGAVAVYRLGEATVEASMDVAEDVVMALVARLGPLLALAAGGALLTVPALRSDLGIAAVSGALDRLAFDAPWAIDLVSGGTEGLLGGTASWGPGLALALAAAAAAAGRPFPPRTEEDAVATLAQAARWAGRLEEGEAVQVSRVPSPLDASAPRNVSDLFADVDGLYGPEETGRIRVIEVPRPDGSSAWVVEIPGTEVWRPVAGENPFDATTDVTAMTEEATLAAAGVREALADAQRDAGRFEEGDPVMLAGHSLGGILAAAVASDLRTQGQQRVTHVVTAGSPIAGFPVPRDVTVLSLEHRQDVVPRLDSTENPDRENWVTVSRDLTGDPDVDGRASAAHATTEYAETAGVVDDLVRSGDNVSLDEWWEGAEPFFAGGEDVEVRDYRIERTGE